MLLMRSGEQGWLLSTGGGNHEFARMFWCDADGQGPRYRVGNGGGARLGPHVLEHAAIDETGVILTWSGGRKSRIPRDWFQYTYA